MSNKLMHYGVLGMKWGRRRGRSSSSSADHKTASRLKKKKLSEMSNDELKKLTQRMQLEKQYKSLKSESSSANIAKKWLGNVMMEAGKEVAKSYVSKALGKGAEKLIAKFPVKK